MNILLRSQVLTSATLKKFLREKKTVGIILQLLQDPLIYLSLTDILAEDLDHKHYSSLLPGERKRTGNID